MERIGPYDKLRRTVESVAFSGIMADVFEDPWFCVSIS